MDDDEGFEETEDDKDLDETSGDEDDETEQKVAADEDEDDDSVAEDEGQDCRHAHDSHCTPYPATQSRASEAVVRTFVSLDTRSRDTEHMLPHQHRQAGAVGGDGQDGFLVTEIARVPRLTLASADESHCCTALLARDRGGGG